MPDGDSQEKTGRDTPPAEEAAPAEGQAAPGKDLRKLFEVWMDSEMKAVITVFYHNNPGVVETLDGLARRLGTTPEALRDHVQAHINLGLLHEKQVGDKTVLVFDRQRRKEFERFIEGEIRRRMEENT